MHGLRSVTGWQGLRDTYVRMGQGRRRRHLGSARLASARIQTRSVHIIQRRDQQQSISLVLTRREEDFDLSSNGQALRGLAAALPDGKPRSAQAAHARQVPLPSAAPTASWMPDSEHVVLSFASSEESIRHLWMADIDSNSLDPLTTGTTEEIYPSVSADGRSILYVQSSDHYDLVSVSVGDGAARTFITTDSTDTGATWSENAKMAWVSSRNGRSEIWIRLPDGSDRPAVTDADFKTTELKGSIQSFMSPALSPDGTRLIYAAAGPQNDLRLWISSLSGGAPARLTNAGTGSEWGGSWSPDGTRFVYFFSQVGKPPSLMTVKTTANAAPALLRENLDDFLPAWSPDGKWIAFHDHGGWNLISPDGKTLKPLGKIETPYFAFSKDAKLLYGIQTGSGQAFWDRAVLFSLDPLTLRQNIIKDLGHDLMPQSPYNPGIRFSLAPDGKSLVYSTYVARDDLWMLQGYRQPSWSARISDALQGK
jgi:Tol biopolymer transport system component